MKFINYLLWLIFPRRCAVCGKVIDRDRSVCSDCEAELEYIDKNCSVCGAIQKYCECKYKVYRFSGCVAPFYKGDNSMKMIYRFKFGNKTDSADFLAEKIYEKVNEYFKDVQFDVVTAVPASFFKYIYKGYNHSEVIAKAVAERMGVDYKRLLKKSPFQKTQHNLKRIERFSNVSGMFYSTKRYAYKNVLLIDDIKSTGATLNECTKQLLFAGAHNVYCAVAVVNVFGIEKK